MTRATPPANILAASVLKTIFILGIAVTAGCRGGAPETPTLTVYSGRSEALVAPLLARFEAETGVRLRIQYADSAQLASTIVTEGAASPADLFFAQDLDSLSLLEEKGLLASLPAEILGSADERFRSPQGTWVGTTGRARVLAWNTQRLTAEQLPRSIDDLAAPQWRGRVGWAPENASFQAFLATMIRLRGEEAARRWVCAVQENRPRAYPSNTPLVTAVGAGEIDVGLANHYYLYRLRAEHGADYPVANHYFRNGAAESMVSVSGVGILSSSSKRDLAERLVAFLLSDESQHWMVTVNFEFPVRDSVALTADLPAPGSLQPPATGPSSGAELRQAIAILQGCGVLP